MSHIYQIVKDILRTPFYQLFFVVAVLFIGAVEVIRLIYDFPAKVHLFGYDAVAGFSLLLFLVVFFLGHMFYVLLFVRPESPFQKLAADYRRFFTVRRFIHALVLFAIYTPFFASYTYFKTMIPKMVPFQHDALFAEIDRMVHFGYHPWEILQPLLGYTAITFFISIAYKFWFVVKFFAMYWQAFSQQMMDVRAQFFLTLLFSWVINGALFALFLSSAGPCFYSDFVADGLQNPYVPLMDYLRDVNENAYSIVHLKSQAYLLDIYHGNMPHIFSGISAMPSMHMSIAMAIVLLCWHYGWFKRTLGLIFLLLTYLGSIHLGWHYAIDGYFAMITTYIIWRGAGWLVRRYKLHEPRRNKTE